MHIVCDCIVNEVFQSQKSGSNWVTATETNTGSQFKFILEGEAKGITPGRMLKINADFKPRVDQKGGNYLSYLSGSLF